MEKLYSTPGQVSSKPVKNHLIKTLLLIWTDESECSQFNFSMSYYQKSSWAYFLLEDPCSKQGTEDILICTHKKWYNGKFHLRTLLTTKMIFVPKITFLQSVQSNSWMKNLWRVVKHIGITSNSGNPWHVNCCRLGSYSWEICLCLCVLTFSS